MSANDGPDTVEQAGPALEDAIERYAAAQAGHPVIVTGWHVIARVTDPELDDAVVLSRITPPHQDIVTDLGLISYASARAQQTATRTDDDA